jgi:hypothetical protein
MTASDLAPQERVRCEVYTRVMGYHRPVTAFNAGKRQEHRDRQYFSEQALGTRSRARYPDEPRYDH